MFSLNYTTYSIVDLITILLLTINIFIGFPQAIIKTKVKMRRRYLKRLLENEKITIHIPSRTIGRPNNVVAIEDYRTYDQLRDILISNKFYCSLSYIPTSGNIEIVENSANVIICGPKNSHIIHKTFQRLSGISFENEGDLWYFVDQGSNIKLYSPMDQSPSTNSDIAFFGKINIYSRPELKVILICGIHALGSQGVASFLNKPEMLDELLKKVRNNKFYCIIQSSYSEETKDIYHSKKFFEPTIL